jgi:hypothetical protein
MIRSTHERFTQRLKGGLFLLAVAFGVLMLSGAPDTSTAQTDSTLRYTTVADPSNQPWDAY